MSVRSMRPENKRPTVTDAVKYACGHAGLVVIITFTNVLGHRASLLLGRALGDVLFVLNGRLRNKIVHNIRYAYGTSLHVQTFSSLVRDVLRHFCQNWIELFCVGGQRLKVLVLDRISVSGREHLEAALAGNRGVVIVSAHYGNYPLIGSKLAREGYRVLMVVRDLPRWSDSSIYRRARAYIDLPSLSTTPERRFFKEALALLRANGLLCMLADENKRYGGVFVDFFGRPASTAPGPAGLALRTGAALLPVFMRRNHDGTQTLCIEPEIEKPETADAESATHELTARFTSVIEEYIRRDPAQWIWTNWRWRTQPGGRSAAAKIPKRISLKRFRRRMRRSFRKRFGTWLR